VNSANQDVYYVLVSQTGAVLNLMRGITDSEELQALAENSFGIHQTALEHIYPVHHPRILMFFELLGGIDDKVAAIVRAEGLERLFRELADRLGDEYLSSTASEPRELYEKAFGPIVKERRKQIEKLLNDTAKRMASEEGQLRRIEQNRSTGVSISLIRQRLAGAPTRDDALREKCVLFTRLLSEVEEALRVTRGVDYRLEVRPASDAVPFSEYRLVWAGAVEPILAGELYPPWCRSDPRKYAYYTARWPIVGTDDQLIASLKKIWRLPTRRDSHHAQLVLLKEEEPLWEEGVTISTSLGLFAMRLADAAHNNSWENLRFARLGRLVKGTVSAYAGLPSGWLPDIFHVRVNTPFGDLLFDLTGSPESKYRYMTVISHCNLAPYIAELYMETNTYTRFCMPERIVEIMTQVLCDFPHPDEGE
jgi:hypothetical protein